MVIRAMERYDTREVISLFKRRPIYIAHVYRVPFGNGDPSIEQFFTETHCIRITRDHDCAAGIRNLMGENLILRSIKLGIADKPKTRRRRKGVFVPLPGRNAVQFKNDPAFYPSLYILKAG